MTRIRILSLCVFALTGVIIFQLFRLQVVHSNAYRNEADRQYATPSSSVFDRGSIFFSMKDGTLLSAATMTTGFKMAIIPNEMQDAEKAYADISSVLAIDRESFFQKAGKRDDPYEEVAWRIPKEEADAITAFAIPGVRLFKEKWRFYPGGILASKVLGFVAYKGDDFSGRYGLERNYNHILSREGNGLYVNFFAEVFSNISDTLFESDTREGDIVTTIEPIVEQTLERELEAIMSTWKSSSAGGIVINPKDGSIYALGQFPSFDANEFSKVSDPQTYSNPLVENVFELGSVMKPLVMVGALDAGLITPETPYYDNGFVTVEGVRINNFDKKGRGAITMQEVISESLNTGMVRISELLGKERLRTYLHSFGLNERTNIDLPNEARSLVSNLQSPRQIEYANASFGQGIAVSPVAAVRAFSALANGGYMVTPHIGSRIMYEGGGTKTLEYPFGEEAIISAESAEAMTRMLVHSFDTVYAGGALSLPNYSVAGKTGTAQIPKEDGTGYHADKHMHSFFGYFPAYDPQFLVFLYTIDPKGVRYASETLLKPFMNMTKFLLNYYEVSPDR